MLLVPWCPAEVFLQMDDVDGHLRVLEVQGARCGVIVGLDSAGDPSFDHILLGLEEDGDGDVLLVGEEGDGDSSGSDDDDDDGWGARPFGSSDGAMGTVYEMDPENLPSYEVRGNTCVCGGMPLHRCFSTLKPKGRRGKGM